MADATNRAPTLESLCDDAVKLAVSAAYFQFLGECQVPAPDDCEWAIPKLIELYDRVYQAIDCQAWRELERANPSPAQLGNRAAGSFVELALKIGNEVRMAMLVGSVGLVEAFKPAFNTQGKAINARLVVEKWSEVVSRLSEIETIDTDMLHLQIQKEYQRCVDRVGPGVADPATRATNSRLFPKGPLGDPDFTKFIFALDVGRGEGLKDAEIARRFTASSEGKHLAPGSLLARYRKLRGEGRVGI